MKFNRVMSIGLLLVLLSGCGLTSGDSTSSSQVSSISSEESFSSESIVSSDTTSSLSSVTSSLTSSSDSTTSSSSSSSSTVDDTPDEYSTPEIANYYSTISSTLRGDELRLALNKVISAGFVNHSYGDLKDIYPYSDVDGSGKMIMYYTGTTRSFSSGSLPSKTNKEHVWPQSWYGTGNSDHSNGSPGADAHNVFPCDSQLNNVRSSASFDELPQEDGSRVYEGGSSGFYGQGGGGTLDYGTPGVPDSYNYVNSNKTVFYPKEGWRGVTARVLLYVATRYYKGSKYDVDLIDQATTLKEGKIGKLSTLLKWNLEEPPTEYETKRNQEIYTRWHNNRNPFIDNPKFACRIWSGFNSNTSTVCSQYSE